jgi:predicted alpha/beta hydrolase
MYRQAAFAILRRLALQTLIFGTVAQERWGVWSKKVSLTGRRLRPKPLPDFCVVLQLPFKRRRPSLVSLFYSELPQTAVRDWQPWLPTWPKDLFDTLAIQLLF